MGTALAACLCTGLPVRAQVARTDSLAATSACWRFSFSAWTPPLDWSKSGHDADEKVAAERVRRIRDSVFVRDSGATASNSMVWFRGPQGPELLLFPYWWPAGVEVVFDSLVPGGTEMTGEATALVANASLNASRARARASQIRCER
jgi:hypothetical protein